MTQRSRWAFSRLARVVAAGTAVVLFGAASLLAQGTTGKIEGTVKDQSGAPIAGAQVLITGSAFSATSNPQGYYFINNVPAGVVTVRAQYIGYAPAEVRNVRVYAGQTMTVDIPMEQRAIEVTGITVTVEQNPIVPRDQVTSKGILQGSAIQALPVDAVNQVLRLQPGVVEGARGLTIRGGRPNEAATYIDGVLVRNYGQQFVAIGANTTATVGANALEEASVTTGATGAAYGEAASGVVSLVTRAGGQQYHGSVSYSTDNISGQSYGTGLNRVEASLGGPLFGNLTFFLGTTLQGQQNDAQALNTQNYPYWVRDGIDTSITVPLDPTKAVTDSQVVNVPKFTQYASGCSDSAAFHGTCKSARRPRNNSDAYTLDGKLQYSFGVGSHLSLTYHRNRNQRMFVDNLFNSVGTSGTRAIGQALILNWSQNLARSSERALFLDANLSWQNDNYVRGILDPGFVTGHTDPFANFTASNFKFVIDPNNFPIDDRLIENLRLFSCDNARPGGAGGCVPYLNRNDLTPAGAYRTNPWGVTEGLYSSNGFDADFPLLNNETRWGGRASLDWQANRYNRIQFGGDYTNVKMQSYSPNNYISQIFIDAYRENPTKLGMYLQDRIDLGDVVIEGGLRYDRLDTRMLYPRFPGRVYTDPIRGGLAALTSTSSPEDTLYAGRCQAALNQIGGLSGVAQDTAAGNLALSTCNFFKAQAQGIWSPSVRVSFPVTDRTGFRLSYSHQVQSPDFYYLATGINTDISSSNTNNIFGRPLDFTKTIMFEFGIRHAFSDDMVLDISAYNKDKVSDLTARYINVYDPHLGGPTNQANEALNLMTNLDFGNVRGVDVKLDRRIGQIFQGTISYTFETAKSTGSDPLEYVGTYGRVVNALTGGLVQPPQALLVVRDNRSHTIAGNLALNFPHGWHSGTTLGSIFEDFGAFATFRFASGLPYTLMKNDGQGTQGPGNGFGLGATPAEPLNGSRMPWIKNVDLRLTRGVRLGGRDLSVFADFRNLFNFTNLNRIFAETGNIANDVYKSKQIQPVLDNLQSDAGSLWMTKAVVVNGVSTALTGVDLSDCSLYSYGSNGTRGVPDCFLLRRAEQRFGNGDGFFDTTEMTSAFDSWYMGLHGPQTLNTQGLNVRIGFEFNF
jgi:outer membrane receptor for ferrienterochelin and colicin